MTANGTANPPHRPLLRDSPKAKQVIDHIRESGLTTIEEMVDKFNITRKVACGLCAAWEAAGVVWRETVWDEERKAYVVSVRCTDG